MRRLRLRIALGAAVIACGTAALGLTPAAGASAGAGVRTLKLGKVAGIRWGLTAWGSKLSSGSMHLPSLCMNLSYDAVDSMVLGPPGKGTLFGKNGVGNTWCIAPARATAVGGPWVFDVDAEYHGLTPPGGVRIRVKEAGDSNTRWLLFFTDPRATRVVARLADGEQLRIPTHPVPASLHRPSKYAVVATEKAPLSPGATRAVRAVAYDAHGHIVGRMPTKKSLQQAVFTTVE